MVHPFFDELRDPNTRLPDSRHSNGGSKELPDLFDFSHHGMLSARTTFHRICVGDFAASASKVLRHQSRLTLDLRTFNRATAQQPTRTRTHQTRPSSQRPGHRKLHTPDQGSDDGTLRLRLIPGLTTSSSLNHESTNLFITKITERRILVTLTAFADLVSSAQLGRKIHFTACS